MADWHEAKKPRARNWIRLFLLILIAVILLGVAGMAIISEQYHGPRTLTAVTTTMPGVPLFPFAVLAPANRTAQRLLAGPLLLMRLQGARTAEAVLLQVPAEPDFVLEWYRGAAPFQDWKALRETEQPNSTRLLFTRNREVLQIIVGHSSNHLITPIEIIYLNGVSPAQLERLAAE